MAWLCAVLLGCLLSKEVPAAGNEAEWPSVPVPERSRLIVAGEGGRMSVNGIPMKIEGFVVAAALAETAGWYRKTLGNPLVESRIGRALVLGRQQGRYFMTVQLEPVAGGTRGVVAFADMQHALRQREQSDAEKAHWQRRLPADSTLISHLRSEEAGKVADHLVYVNRHGPALNRDRLVALLQEDDLSLVQELPAAGRAQASRAEDAVMLQFLGKGKEAVAVISRDDSGKTGVVLNIVVSLEHFE